MMPRPAFRLLARLGFLLTAFSAPVSAASERGLPLIKAYSRLDHKAHTSFHAPFLSSDGLYYAGNQLALMEFDGRTWRILKIPLTYTRALAPDAAGNIYVGDEEQLGFVTRPGNGDAVFRSLLDRVPADAKPFGFVRDVVVWRRDVFFATDKNILRYQPASDSFHVFPLDGTFRNRLSAIGDRLVLHRRGEGLYVFEAEAWKSLSRDPLLAATGGGFVINGETSAPSDLVVGLSGHGLFRLQSDGALHAWPTGADAILARTQLLTALRLHDGAIAIGTESEGLVVVGSDGRLERHLNRDSGLPHATVFALAEDRDGGLWVSTNSGPARVQWRSAATWFDHLHSGITDAAAADFARHRGTFYYLSADGLYRLIPSDDPARAARFERDPHVGVQVRLTSLLSHPGGLLLASASGLQRLTPDGLELLTAVRDGLKCLAASPSQPSRIYFATDRGVGTGRFNEDGSWSYEGKIPGLAGECEDVVEDAGGVLWVSTVNHGVYRVTRPAGSTDWKTCDAKLLTTADGLPEGHSLIFLWQTGLGLHFDTAHGLYRFDAAAARFQADAALTAWEPRPMVLNPVANGAPGELWTNGLLTDYKTKEVPYPLLRLRQWPDGSVDPFPVPNEIHALFAGSGARRIFWEPGENGSGVVWAKSELGLVRLEVERLASPRTAAAPLIRDIQAEGRPVNLPDGPLGHLTFRFSPEPITITFASGRFDPPEFERFQTRLLGFNDAWSAPTRRNDVSFTNLERGPFTFEVRAVDPRGQPGPATSLSLYVTPPWHRSNLAYAIYVLATGGAVFGFVRHRLQRATREQARLEQLVAQRTAALDAANKAKSMFLANMSHELRTPLNGVIGYAQVLMKSPDLSNRDRERLSIVQSSGEHLLRMINEVLDFSKIEAGKLDLRLAPFHLPQLLRDIANALEPRAAQKGLHFTLETASDLPVNVIGDAQKLRQVLDNLLSNAVKFTASGSVTLRVSTVQPRPTQPSGSNSQLSTLNSQLAPLNSQLPPPGSQLLSFTVADTGVGISTRDQAALFQPFHQPVDGRPPEPGTGLGLAITKRLVELMHGTLAFESSPNSGSTFSVSLPLEVLATEIVPAPPALHGPIGYTGPRRRLLVVDDVAVNRSVLIDLLAPLGFEMTAADSGEKALALLPDVRPHLVFLDLRMPGMDGLELAQRLRQAADRDRRPVLIAMSASVLSFSREKALEAGCDDFLPKPFRESELIAKLAMHLHVQWRRGDTAQPFPTTTSRSSATIAELEPLLETAKRGEIRSVREQIATLREQHPSDPHLLELETLARSYEMEKLRTQLAHFISAWTPS